MAGLNQQQIEQVCQKFFSYLDGQTEIKIEPLQEKTLPVRVQAQDPRILIGQNGQTLFEIQRLLGAMLRRIIGQELYLDLDINNYKQKKADYLREIANHAADTVVLTGQPKELSPMSAIERRIIHLELAGRSDIVSESSGEGEKRRVVIRPRS